MELTKDEAVEDCLLEWVGQDCCDVDDCDGKGLFNLWENAGEDENTVDRTRLAEQIRDLPVRESEAEA